MIPKPQALPSLLPSELLTYVLDQSYSTTLLICQTRNTFIDSLISDILLLTQDQQSSKCNDRNASTQPLAESSIQGDFKPHTLLTPTLHQLAISRHINVVFLPTVSHLRAYLSVFPALSEYSQISQTPDKITDKYPAILIYGLIDLHYDTYDWSAQGLGNTFACLVEAGRRSGKKIIIMERWERNIADRARANTEDFSDEVSRRSAWTLRIPILHTSTKFTGPHHDEQYWSGRTTEVGRIVARWFTFGF